MNLKAGKNIRLFKNDFLEKLTFVHPWMPISVWMPVSIFSFAYSLQANTFIETVGLFFLGLFIWTFTEYTLHRFFFHYHARSEIGKKFFYLIHGIHHDDPDDQRRLLMPLSAAFILAALLFGLFYLFFGSQYVFGFFSGFLIGYLCYDYVHFFTHFGRYKSGFMKHLQKQHMVHHFNKPHALYGVSSPLWDYVFKTKK